MTLSRQTYRIGNPTFSEIFIDLLYEKPSAFESTLLEIIMEYERQLHLVCLLSLFQKQYLL
jgi:hypothetical protein